MMVMKQKKNHLVSSRDICLIISRWIMLQFNSIIYVLIVMSNISNHNIFYFFDIIFNNMSMWTIQLNNNMDRSEYTTRPWISL